MSVHESNPIERAIVALSTVVLWLTVTAIFAILTVNTGLRYAFGTSLQWANEVPELLFPWLVMAGVVMAAVHGSHIATTFLMDSVPKPLQRVVACVSWLVVAAMYLVLSGSTYKMLEIVHDEKSPILQVPGSVTYGCMAGGMVVLAVLALMSAWRAVWGSGRVPGSGEETLPHASAAQG